ncbi:MAG: hypothetical protein RXR06_12130 [Thermoproteus sp.]
MPKAKALELLAREEKARELLKERGCFTAVEVGERLGISYNQAYYVVKRLAESGEAVPYMGGKITVWCRPNVEGDVYATAINCLGKVQPALAKAVEGFKSRRASLTIQRLIKILNGMCRGRLKPSATLYSLVRAYVEPMLDGAIVERIERDRGVLYILDVEKLKGKIKLF